MLAEPEVDNLDVLRGHVHQDVVEFQVAMGVPLRMHVCDAFDKLLEDVLAGGLWQPLVRHLLDMMEDAHALAQLHDQVDLRALVDDLVQFHYVRVPEV